MFSGEKTVLFWAGLLIVGFASAAILFTSLYSLIVDSFLRGYGFVELRFQIPNLVIGVTFVLIGLYMMKSGVKKNSEASASSQRLSQSVEKK